MGLTNGKIVRPQQQLLGEHPGSDNLLSCRSLQLMAPPSRLTESTRSHRSFYDTSTACASKPTEHVAGNEQRMSAPNCQQFLGNVEIFVAPDRGVEKREFKVALLMRKMRTPSHISFGTTSGHSKHWELMLNVCSPSWRRHYLWPGVSDNYFQRHIISRMH